MPEALIIGIVIFRLTTFLGFERIHRVPPTLHTPLMSGAGPMLLNPPEEREARREERDETGPARVREPR